VKINITLRQQGMTNFYEVHELLSDPLLSTVLKIRMHRTIILFILLLKGRRGE
jgi:hypothetical protein